MRNYDAVNDVTVGRPVLDGGATTATRNPPGKKSALVSTNCWFLLVICIIISLFIAPDVLNLLTAMQRAGCVLYMLYYRLYYRLHVPHCEYGLRTENGNLSSSNCSDRADFAVVAAPAPPERVRCPIYHRTTEPPRG